MLCFDGCNTILLKGYLHIALPKEGLPLLVSRAPRSRHVPKMDRQVCWDQHGHTPRRKPWEFAWFQSGPLFQAQQLQASPKTSRSAVHEAKRRRGQENRLPRAGPTGQSYKLPKNQSCQSSHKDLDTPSHSARFRHAYKWRHHQQTLGAPRCYLQEHRFPGRTFPRLEDLALAPAHLSASPKDAPSQRMRKDEVNLR